MLSLGNGIALQGCCHVEMATTSNDDDDKNDPCELDVEQKQACPIFGRNCAPEHDAVAVNWLSCHHKLNKQAIASLSYWCWYNCWCHVSRTSRNCLPRAVAVLHGCYNSAAVHMTDNHVQSRSFIPKHSFQNCKWNEFLLRSSMQDQLAQSKWMKSWKVWEIKPMRENGLRQRTKQRWLQASKIRLVRPRRLAGLIEAKLRRVKSVVVNQIDGGISWYYWALDV